MRANVFNITQEEDGGYCAATHDEGIFTQGDTWQELRDMVQDATECCFLDELDTPTSFRLFLRLDGKIGDTVTFTLSATPLFTTH